MINNLSRFCLILSATLLFQDGAVAREPAQVAANAKVVEISGFQFRPPELTVVPHTTVIWLNRDQTIHNVVRKDGQSGSPGLDTDDRYSTVFDHEGDFPYFCGLHPQMVGVVHVRAP